MLRSMETNYCLISNIQLSIPRPGALATQCEQKELWQYAGLCWLAAARCQGTLGNATTEAGLLARAGRQFLTAEKKNSMIGCPSPGQENVQVIRCANIFGYLFGNIVTVFNAD